MPKFAPQWRHYIGRFPLQAGRRFTQYWQLSMPWPYSFIKKHNTLRLMSYTIRM
jgi:hypothetical protein